MYEAAASCKDVSRDPVTNWERLQDTVRRETRDVTMFCYGLAARTEQNTRLFGSMFCYKCRRALRIPTCDEVVELSPVSVIMLDYWLSLAPGAVCI